MRSYDRSQPLIFIHVPKAAGTTTRQIFDQWFGAGLLPHYYRESEAKMPEKHDIFALHRFDQPLVVYGHFNRKRQFGIEDYYPDARQFISILRDPFELMVSAYFFMNRHAHGWADRTRAPGPSVNDYLNQNKSTMLNHFPRMVTFDNYKEIIEEFFIEIGIAERLEASMQRIANKLGMPFDTTTLGYLNVSERNQEVAGHLRDIFVDNNQLEYAVYNYVKNKFNEVI
jgi:hypothetical protein